MKTEITNPFPNSNCFFCGSDNQLGLKLRFFWDEDRKEVSTEYLPPKHFAGQGDILHGAIQAGLLDEIMGWTSFFLAGKKAVTTDLNIRFLKPVYIDGKQLKVACRLVRQEGSKVHLEGILTDSQGIACTSATGTFHILSPERYEALIHGKL